MYLIIGLGNPGKEYEHTRHNVGFIVIDALYEYLAKENGCNPWKTDKHFQSDIAEASFEGEKVLLVKPLTYMNLSGQAVKALISFYKIPLEKTLIIYDEFDLPLGSLRLRQQGSAGTHNGMRSVVQVLGTNDIPRLRVGISLPDSLKEKIPQKPIKDFVLEKFYPDEHELKNKTITKAVKVILNIIKEGHQRTMDKINNF